MNTEPSLPKKNKKLTIFLVVIGVFVLLCGCLPLLIAIVSPDKEETKTTDAHSIALSTAVKELETTRAVTITTELASTSTATSIPTLVFQVSFSSESNVRTGPGLGFPVSKVMKAGESAQVYERNEDSTWLRIDPGEQLWVHISVAKPDFPVDSLPLAPTLTATIGPSETPTNTPLPSATLEPRASLNNIYKNLEEMTSLQFNEYKNSIIGKPVREVVKVGDVLDDGRVSINGPWTPSIINISEFGVVVEGVPYDVAITLDGGDEIYLEATIDRIVGDYNYFSNRENTLVLVYKGIENKDK